VVRSGTTRGRLAAFAIFAVTAVWVPGCPRRPDTDAGGRPDTAGGDSAVEPDTGRHDTGIDSAADTADPTDSDPTSGGSAARLRSGPLLDIATAWTGTADGEQLGFAIAAAGDTNGDGLGDLIVGAFGNRHEGRQAGAAYLIRGMANPESGEVSVGWPLYGEQDGDQAARAVDGAGDVDGDGLDDILVGAMRHDTAGTDSGAAYVVLGTVSGPAPNLADALRYTGIGAGQGAGFAVAGRLDMNGDGLGEVVVTGTGGAGGLSAWIVPGSPFPASSSLASAIELRAGESSDDDTLVPSAAGDVDGDGLDDVLLGRPGATSAGVRCGAAFLVPGTDSLGSVDLADVATWAGEAEGDAAGFSVARGGDVDGDGHLDLLVGAPGRDGAAELSGAVYLVLGGADMRTGTLADALEIPAPSAGDMAGTRIEGGVDLDLDGFADTIVGVDNTDRNAGAAYVLYGAPEPADALADGVKLWGDAPEDKLGSAVAALSDFTGDGLPDLAVGAVGVHNNRGAVYLVVGQTAPGSEEP
jgi:hypothetical protein